MCLGSGQMTWFGQWDVRRRDTSKLVDSTHELLLFCIRHHQEKELPRLTCQSLGGEWESCRQLSHLATPRLDWLMQICVILPYAIIFFSLHPNITQPPWTLVKGQMHTHYGCEFTAQRDGTAGGYRFGWSIQTGRGGATALTSPSLPFLPSWD